MVNPRTLTLTYEQTPIDDDLDAARGALKIAERRLDAFIQDGAALWLIEGAEDQVKSCLHVVNVLTVARAVARE